MVSKDDILGASLLIVDDQEANVALLTHMLSGVGYTRISSTMNPESVCALHRDNGYDIILLDLQMPRMDGFAVMAALESSCADPYLPVLVMTAEPRHKLRALQAGARDFVSEPFDFLEIETRIHNLLEVRLLHKRLEQSNVELERVVQERTAELRDSEACYRRLAELASDWYWEQDEHGKFTKVSGPVPEMLGIRVEGLGDGAIATELGGWDEAQRKVLHHTISERRPFLDFLFTRANLDGSKQSFHVSGEPMFNRSCRFIGYRGIGVEITSGR